MTIRILSAVVGIVGAGFVAGNSGSQKITLDEEARRDLGVEVGLVELRHVAESKDPVIAVPLGALLEETGNFVYLREEETDSFLKQKVEVGLRGKDYVELLSGVFPGDSVVVKNVGRISEAKTERAPEEVATVKEEAGAKNTERGGGFVDRSVEKDGEPKEEVAAEKAVVVEGDGNGKKAEEECPLCGKRSMDSKGFCRNGSCEEPPRAARAHSGCEFGGGGGRPSGYGSGAGGCDFGGHSNCPPPSCRR